MARNRLQLEEQPDWPTLENPTQRSDLDVLDKISDPASREAFRIQVEADLDRLGELDFEDFDG